MSGNWEWLIGRELSLGEVVSVFDGTATVERGDDRFRILVDELLHEDYRSRDRQLAARMGEITPAGAYQQFFDTQARADHAPKEEQEPYKWPNP